MCIRDSCKAFSSMYSVVPHSAMQSCSVVTRASPVSYTHLDVYKRQAMSRETILRQYLDTLKGQYSHILIDCQPSLGMLTVNALAAANRIIIPVQAEYLPAKGLEQLLSTVNKVKRQINPKLQIDGILLTMVDSRTNFAKEISALLRETYGSKIKVFGTEIPHSVRAKEISAEGKSIFAHDPSGKVAEGYKNLTKEVLKLEKQREKNRAGLSRCCLLYTSYPGNADPVVPHGAYGTRDMGAVSVQVHGIAIVSSEIPPVLQLPVR